MGRINSSMISPVCGQRAQKSISVASTKATGASSGNPGTRSGRCKSGAVRLSTMTLIGTTR